MSATNFTPIQLYRTSTAAAVPTAGNLAAGELAINLTDERLYFKNAAGTVKVLASSGASTVGGSNTQVQYNNNGVLGGSANFVFDGTNVGVGTASPGVRLDVVGQARATTLYATSSTASSFVSRLTNQDFQIYATNGVSTGNSGDVKGTIGLYFADNLANLNGGIQFTRGGAGTDGWMNFLTSGAERMRITSAGDVGIGTTSTLAKLHVAANATYQQYLTGTDINQQLRLGYDTTNNVGKIQSVQVGVGFKDLVLQPEGNNVGIGVTPSAWSGGFRAVQFSGGNSFYSQGGQASLGSNAYNDSGWKYVGTGTAGLFTNVAGEFAWFNAASGTAGNAISFTQAMTLDASGRLGIGTAAASLASKVVIEGTLGTTASQIQIVGTGVRSGYIGPSSNGLEFGTDSGGLVFRTGVTGNASVTTGSERMRITSAGDVGIGASSPTIPLEVTKNGTNSGALGYSNVAKLVDASGNKGLLIGYADASQTTVLTANSSAASSNMSFWTYEAGGSAWAERMRITAGGSVGIGTDAPTSRLEVAGSIRTTQSTGGVFNMQYTTANAASRSWQINHDVQVYGDFAIQQSTTQTGNTFADRLYIDASGNVGIGNSAPGTKLDVQGTVAGNFFQNLYNDSSNAAAQTLYLAKSFGASGVQFGQTRSSANGFVNLLDAAALTFGTNNTERMRITSSGYVGIGTTTPGERLSIVSTDAYQLSFKNSTASSLGAIGYNSTDNMLFNANGAERLRITAAGYLEFPNGTSSRPGSSGQYIVIADNGGFFQQVGANYYTVTTSGGSTSDATLKKNVQQLDGALQKICAVRGVNFEFIEQPLSTSDCGTQIGVIAQEIEAQFPEIVVTHENGKKSVRYDRLVAPLIEAIKELTARVAQLEGN